MLDLCRVYIDLHAKPHNKSWRKDLERMELFIVGRPEESHIDPKTGEKVIDRPAHRPPLPGLRNTKVKAVTRQDIIDLQRIIGVEMGKETTANRVLSLLSSMFTQARVQFGMLEPNSANPVEGVRRFPGRKRKRFMRKVEAPAVVAALNQEFNIYARAACWIYMLIGTRREELLAVRWEPHVDAPKDQEPDPHVVLDEEGNEHIYFHDTKAGREFILPLPTEAVAIFRELQKWRIAGNPYVFCGKKDGAHLVNITKPWRRVKKAAGVEGITIHDLRRTVGNRLREKTKDLGIVGAALNQTNASVQEVYGVYDVDPVREALEDHATELKRQTGGVNLLPVAPPKRDTTPRKYRKSKPAAPDQ